jgi:hypothetical protein
MPGFRSMREYADAQNNGQVSFCSLRKVPSQASTASWWVDLSMAAGNPLPNYYASSPLVAATLDGWRGIFHGDDKSPSSKFLAEWGLMTATAGLVGPYRLLDYLLFYPFIDLDDLDVQTMDNTVTLPRYEDGAGVLPMLVCVAPTTGGGSFTFDYINQDGVSKTAPTQSYPATASTIAQLLRAPADASGPGPFLRLNGGDTGVRSITSWTNLGAGGGLAALVLVKPLANLVIYEVSNMAETEYLSMIQGPPRIHDGAYLNLIMNCAATVAAGLLTGYCRFTWN